MVVLIIGSGGPHQQEWLVLFAGICNQVIIDVIDDEISNIVIKKTSLEFMLPLTYAGFRHKDKVGRELNYDWHLPQIQDEEFPQVNKTLVQSDNNSKISGDIAKYFEAFIEDVKNFHKEVNKYKWDEQEKKKVCVEAIYVRFRDNIHNVVKNLSNEEANANIALIMSSEYLLKMYHFNFHGYVEGLNGMLSDPYDFIGSRLEVKIFMIKVIAYQDRRKIDEKPMFEAELKKILGAEIQFLAENMRFSFIDEKTWFTKPIKYNNPSLEDIMEKFLMENKTDHVVKDAKEDESNIINIYHT